MDEQDAPPPSYESAMGLPVVSSKLLLVTTHKTNNVSTLDLPESGPTVQKSTRTQTLENRNRLVEQTQELLDNGHKTMCGYVTAVGFFVAFLCFVVMTAILNISALASLTVIVVIYVILMILIRSYLWAQDNVL